MVKLYWNTADKKIVYLNGYVTDKIDIGMIGDSQRIASLMYSDTNAILKSYMQYVKPKINETSEYGYINDIYDECNPWCVFVNYDDSVLDGPKMITVGDTPEYDGQSPKREDSGATSYEFIGWSDEIGPMTGNTVYMAQYREIKKEFVISFINYDGSLIENVICKAGDVPACSITPTKPSDNTYTYEFKEWYPELVPADSDTTYKAIYNSIYINYVIDFYSESSRLDHKELHYGDVVVYTGEEPTKEGYKCTGWDPTLHPVNGNQNYMALFDILKLSAIFKDYNGTKLQESTLDYGSVPVYTGSTTPSRPRTDRYIYTFNKEWTPSLEPITADTIYTPLFTQTEPDYLVTFDLNGIGTMPTTQLRYTYGQVLSSNANYKTPESSSYNFINWYKNPSFEMPSVWTATNTFSLSTIGGSAMTLYAKWAEKEKGSITLSVDKTNVTSESGQTVTFYVNASGSWEIDNVSTTPTGTSPVAYFQSVQTGSTSTKTITGTTTQNTLSGQKVTVYRAWLLNDASIGATCSITQSAPSSTDFIIPYVDGQPKTQNQVTVESGTTSANIIVSASTNWIGTGDSAGIMDKTTGNTGITNVKLTFTSNPYTGVRNIYYYFTAGTATNNFTVTQKEGAGISMSASLNFGTSTSQTIDARGKISGYTQYSDYYYLVTIKHDKGYTSSAKVKLSDMAARACGNYNNIEFNIKVCHGGQYTVESITLMASPNPTHTAPQNLFVDKLKDKISWEINGHALGGIY